MMLWACSIKVICCTFCSLLMPFFFLFNFAVDRFCPPFHSKFPYLLHLLFFCIWVGFIAGLWIKAVMLYILVVSHENVKSTHFAHFLRTLSASDCGEIILEWKVETITSGDQNDLIPFPSPRRKHQRSNISVSTQQFPSQIVKCLHHRVCLSPVRLGNPLEAASRLPPKLPPLTFVLERHLHSRAIRSYA